MSMMPAGVTGIGTSKGARRFGTVPRAMPIPPLTERGLLPPGLYSGTLSEVRQRFGAFQKTEHRVRLFQRLEAFAAECGRSGIVRALILNGSFVTSKADPNDIDLLVVLPAGHDFRADLGPSSYNVVDRKRVRRVFGFDVFVVEDESADYAALTRFFQRVRLQPDVFKGILRVEL